MAKKNLTYEAYMAEQMLNTEFAQEFILLAVREGEPIEDAVRRAVKVSDVKQFAQRSGIDRDYLAAFVRGDKKLTQKRLERILAVFDLKLTVARVRRSRRKAA